MQNLKYQHKIIKTGNRHTVQLELIFPVLIRKISIFLQCPRLISLGVFTDIYNLRIENAQYLAESEGLGEVNTAHFNKVAFHKEANVRTVQQHFSLNGSL